MGDGQQVKRPARTRIPTTAPYRLPQHCPRLYSPQPPHTHLDLHPPLGLLAVVRNAPVARLVQPAAAQAVGGAALAVVVALAFALAL